MYQQEDNTYAEFRTENNDIGIEYDEKTKKVTELHFSIMIEVDRVLEKQNYISNEEATYYFNQDTNILTVPIKNID